MIMAGTKTLSAALTGVAVEAQASGAFTGGKICVIGES